jgi:hypothetical protein
VNKLGEGGGRSLAEALCLNTTVALLDLGNHLLRGGAGRTLAEALRVNTTVASLNLGINCLGEGAGRTLAEALRLNTTIASLEALDCCRAGLDNNHLGEGRGRMLAETLSSRSCLCSRASSVRATWRSRSVSAASTSESGRSVWGSDSPGPYPLSSLKSMVQVV